ncbi:MAG: hypothetical protein GKS05_05275 [Nitrospirales bacterium]|nr:hypothetical protein [Nitrospirales bacterium]
MIHTQEMACILVLSGGPLLVKAVNASEAKVHLNQLVADVEQPNGH